MREKILGFSVLALAGVLAFTGCNKKDDSNTGPSPVGTWRMESAELGSTHEVYTCATATDPDMITACDNQRVKVESDGSLKIYDGDTEQTDVKLKWKVEGEHVYVKDLIGEIDDGDGTFHRGEISESSAHWEYYGTFKNDKLSLIISGDTYVWVRVK